MSDNSIQHYYGANDSDGWRGYVYHYDPSGNKRVYVWLSERRFDTKEQAEDAACEWLEDHPEIEATWTCE